MGVEYEHALLVNDVAWRPGIDAALAVIGVLEEYGLVVGKPEVYDLAGGLWKKAKSQSLRAAATLPDNCAIHWKNLLDDEQNSPSVARVFGPSHYDSVTDDDRYVQRVSLILGSDFRTLSGWECFQVEATAGPSTARGRQIEPLDDVHYSAHSDIVWPADFTAKPPRARLVVEKWWVKPSPPTFDGIWRSGLFLDCGKDLPAIVERSSELPNTDFVGALSDAFGAPLAQIGWLY